MDRPAKELLLAFDDLGEFPPGFEAQSLRLAVRRGFRSIDVAEFSRLDERSKVALLSELGSDVPLPVLEIALEDAHWLVVEYAVFLVGEHRVKVFTERLLSLWRNHEEPLVREAVLAALASIGAKEAVPVILEGLAQRNVYIRRRAVVAACAFDSPELDNALKSMVKDRDFQVRALLRDIFGIED